MVYRIRLTETAEGDLKSIYNWIAERAAPATARGYIDRILGFLAGFNLFPERGAVRDDVLPGLRVVGFERRVSIAFVIEDDEVVVLRILYAGRELKLQEEG